MWFQLISIFGLQTISSVLFLLIALGFIIFMLTSHHLKWCYTWLHWPSWIWHYSFLQIWIIIGHSMNVLFFPPSILSFGKSSYPWIKPTKIIAQLTDACHLIFPSLHIIWVIYTAILLFSNFLFWNLLSDFNPLYNFYFRSFKKYIFLVSTLLFNILNMVVTTVLISLSAKSNSCVRSSSTLIDWFFSKLTLSFCCFFLCLIILD